MNWRRIMDLRSKLDRNRIVTQIWSWLKSHLQQGGQLILQKSTSEQSSIIHLKANSIQERSINNKLEKHQFCLVPSIIDSSINTHNKRQQTQLEEIRLENAMHIRVFAFSPAPVTCCVCALHIPFSRGILVWVRCQMPPFLPFPQRWFANSGAYSIIRKCIDCVINEGKSITRLGIYWSGHYDFVNQLSR